MPTSPRPRVVALSSQKLLMHRLQTELELTPCTTQEGALAAMEKDPTRLLLLDLEFFASPFDARHWLKLLHSALPVRRLALVMFTREPEAAWANQLAEDYEAVLHHGPLADRPLAHTVLQANSLLNPVPA